MINKEYAHTYSDTDFQQTNHFFFSQLGIIPPLDCELEHEFYIVTNCDQRFHEKLALERKHLGTEEITDKGHRIETKERGGIHVRSHMCEEHKERKNIPGQGKIQKR